MPKTILSDCEIRFIDLHATVESTERVLHSLTEATSFKHVLSQQQSLLTELGHLATDSHTVSLAHVEEIWAVRQHGTEINVQVDGRGAIHPTYAQVLADLVGQLVAAVSLDRSKHIAIRQMPEAIELRLCLDTSVGDFHDLRNRAVAAGFLSQDAPQLDTYDGQLTLLPITDDANKPLLSDVSLLATLQSLGAEVTGEPTEGTNSLVVRLPVNAKLENITVFRFGNELYGVWTSAVIDIDFSLLDQASFRESTIEHDENTFHVIEFGQSSSKPTACVYLEGADKPLALFVDTVESPGDLLIHSVSNETLPYISGSVRAS